MDYSKFTLKKDNNKIKFIELQALIVKRMEINNFVYCLDEAGTGKTIQGLYLISSVLENYYKNITYKPKILVVAGKSYMLAKQWKNAIEKFLDKSVYFCCNTQDNKEILKKSYLDYDIMVTYSGSNYSNLGINQINHWINKEYSFNSKENIINWDLIIFDEAHDIFSKYYDVLLYGDNDNQFKARAHKVAFFTATPFAYRNKNILGFYKDFLLDKKEVELNLDPGMILDINIELPVQRNIKELFNDGKNRNIDNIKYEITNELEEIWELKGPNSPYKDFGNIWLMLDKYYPNKIQKSSYEYQREFYLKSSDVSIIEKGYNSYKNIDNKYISRNKCYSNNDIQNIFAIDKKLESVINSDYIRNGEKENKIIFCNRISTKNLLLKIFRSEYILESLNLNKEDIISADELNLNEDNDDLTSFNNTKTSKKILISTWQKHGTGFNIYGADTVIAYELPMTLSLVEQGFGRIDRLGKGYDELNFIYVLPNTDKCMYDNFRLHDICYISFKNILDIAYSTKIGIISKVPIRNFIFSKQEFREYFLKFKKAKLEELENILFVIKKIIYIFNRDLVKSLKLDDEFGYDRTIDLINKNRLEEDILKLYSYISLSYNIFYNQSNEEDNYEVIEGIQISNLLDLFSDSGNINKKFSVRYIERLIENKSKELNCLRNIYNSINATILYLDKQSGEVCYMETDELKDKIKNGINTDPLVKKFINDFKENIKLAEGNN